MTRATRATRLRPRAALPVPTSMRSERRSLPPRSVFRCALQSCQQPARHNLHVAARCAILPAPSAASNSDDAAVGAAPCAQSHPAQQLTVQHGTAWATAWSQPAQKALSALAAGHTACRLSAAPDAAPPASFSSGGGASPGALATRRRSAMALAADATPPASLGSGDGSAEPRRSLQRRSLAAAACSLAARHARQRQLSRSPRLAAAASRRSARQSPAPHRWHVAAVTAVRGRV